ncbi:MULTISPECIES: ribonuclease P protein subunit [Halopenitus]|uniref:Ribonuclease P protein component 1 n=1 Tax=Halopenitus malekzadehii TaxID=1267564 RepID=A0A1H6J1D2_9EURY|nr:MULTISPECIES: ribonuclease P protein subunit [Halopenitus]SEH53264.1 ribonuclease P protein subunit POP4 [Halopenitus malekzadehii]
MLTPDTLTRHELVGLPIRVADARNADSVGCAGRVVDESQRTLSVRTPSGDKRVPKSGTTFEFAIVDRPRVGTVADDRSAVTDDTPTDEAAGGRKAPGSTFELGPDTAGVRPRQSRPSDPTATGDSPDCDGAASRSLGECEDVVYVTVDGDKLLSRPAERTERGVSVWR